MWIMRVKWEKRQIYLKSIQKNIYKLQTGTAQPHIYPKSVENLNIPLPSIEQQNSIIEFYESNQVKINELENEIKKLKELEKKFISNLFKIDNTNSVNIKDDTITSYDD